MSPRSIIVAAALLLAAPPCARADAPAEALLQKCVDAEAKLKSLQANVSLRQETGATTRSLHGVVKLQRPNRALISLEGGQASEARTLASDGRKFTIYRSSDNEFEQEAADPSGGNVGRAASLEVTIFFNPDVLNQLRARSPGPRRSAERPAVSCGSQACRHIRRYRSLWERTICCAAYRARRTPQWGWRLRRAACPT
jgi:hypothetical protein